MSIPILGNEANPDLEARLQVVVEQVQEIKKFLDVQYEIVLALAEAEAKRESDKDG